jgi:hypothetical protein
VCQATNYAAGILQVVSYSVYTPLLEANIFAVKEFTPVPRRRRQDDVRERLKARGSLSEENL